MTQNILKGLTAYFKISVKSIYCKNKSILKRLSLTLHIWKKMKK